LHKKSWKEDVMVTARRGKAAKGEASDGSTDGDAAATLRVLKKYPNRRLYDTQTSSYITLADVKTMVLGGQAFEVRDAKTGDDITRSILLQIILEEETGGVPMFSTSSLEQIIRLYGHAMQGVMGAYLEQNMQAFTDLQKQFAEQSKGMAFSPELWTQFLGGQAPTMPTMTAMPDLMGNYMEQSKHLLEKMQEQMKNAGALFPGMPGFPPKK
jgi:polyhydroxyalkanoate synthesis repressor PhaR